MKRSIQILVLLLLLVTISHAQDGFTPPLINEYSSGAFVELDEESQTLEANMPVELRPIARYLADWVKVSMDDLSLVAQYSSSQDENRRCAMYRLHQEDFISAVYGSAWDEWGPSLLKHMELYWNSKNECIPGEENTTVDSTYDEYKQAARRLITGLELSEYNVETPAIYIIDGGTHLANLRDPSLDDLGFLDSLGWVGFEETTGTFSYPMIVPFEDYDSLQTGQNVYVNYFEDSIHLFFSLSIVAKDYRQLYVILRSGQSIILPPR